MGKVFASLGAHVIEADLIARQLMQPGQKVYEEVVRRFGQEILAADGTINRKALADKAFGTPERPASRAAELNSIVHPAVGRAQEAWMEDITQTDHQALAVVEAALIFEAGLQGQFDRIVVVTCPAATRVRRWMARNYVEEAAARQELERRMAVQWLEEKKVAAADFLIDNSGSPAEMEMRAREVYGQLKAQASEPAG